MNFTKQELMQATGAGLLDAAKYCDELNISMERFQINQKKRCAAFLATVAVESANLSTVEEGLYYKDPERLMKIYPRAFRDLATASKYTRNPAGLSQLLYQGFHGRGLIQLTWLKNYARAGALLGYDYASYPELLLQPKHAVLTACWFWESNGCNEAADRGDMGDVTRRVNGPARLHLAERVEQYNKNMEWMLG